MDFRIPPQSPSRRKERRQLLRQDVPERMQARKSYARRDDADRRGIPQRTPVRFRQATNSAAAARAHSGTLRGGPICRPTACRCAVFAPPWCGRPRPSSRCGCGCVAFTRNGGWMPAQPPGYLHLLAATMVHLGYQFAFLKGKLTGHHRKSIRGFLNKTTQSNLPVMFSPIPVFHLVALQFRHRP